MDRSAQNPGFFVSGGQVFLSSFLGSLSRRVNSGSQEPRTAQCSLRVSGSLQPRGRWARSGSQQSAGAVGVALRAGATSPGAREHLACGAVSSGSQQFAGVGDGVGRLIVLHMLPGTSFLLEISSLLVLVVLLGCGSLLCVLMQWSEDILMDALAVMVRSSVLREDGGHLAPCRGRLGRFGTFIVVCLRT